MSDGELRSRDKLVLFPVLFLCRFCQVDNYCQLRHQSVSSLAALARTSRVRGSCRDSKMLAASW